MGKKGCKLTVKEKMKKSLYCLQDYQHIATHLSSAGAVLQNSSFLVPRKVKSCVLNDSNKERLLVCVCFPIFLIIKFTTTLMSCCKLLHLYQIKVKTHLQLKSICPYFCLSLFPHLILIHSTNITIPIKFITIQKFPCDDDTF